MQAIRQACSVRAHGPEPIKAFHSLCKHINIASGDGSEKHRVDKGTSLARKCIAEAFTDAEQKKIKIKIDVSAKVMRLVYEKNKTVAGNHRYWRGGTADIFRLSSVLISLTDIAVLSTIFLYKLNVFAP